MAHDIPDLTTLLEMEPHGPDTFVAVSPAYPWGRVYGGQAVAQGLWAATSTVPEGYAIHSLHGYFIRGGDYDEPIRYEVDRVRNGRSFVTRSVTARQGSGAIFVMTASFQVAEAETEQSTAAMPDVPRPEEIEPLEIWGALFDRRIVYGQNRGEVHAWLRLTQDLGDDPVLAACGLAYLSDDMPTEAVMRLHPDSRGWAQDEGRFVSATLDHAIWFHRPSRPHGWNLHTLRCQILNGARGLAIGEVFSQSGDHVATITQEVLLRQRS